MEQKGSAERILKQIPYEIVYSARKTLAVQVKADGSVVVRAPKRMAKYKIEAFLKEKQDWIHTHREKALAHVLTVIRRRMKEGGQAILSVEPPSGDDQIRIGTVKSADGKVWWAAFTSFDEELKGSSSVKSTFLVSLEQLIHMASETKEISGVILNPWNRTIMLDHTLLSIIIGEENAGH